MSSTILKLAAVLGLLGAVIAGCAATALPGGRDWTPDELAILSSLWIGSLGELPPDPSNRWADDEGAARLGQALFFDTLLSVDGTVSCATCHRPELQFQDGTPLATGVGTTTRRTMTIVATAWSPWLFWDGRKDSQWSQALGPLESPVEHGGDRTMYAHELSERYGPEYEATFGPLPALDHLPRRAGPVEDPAARAAWEAMAVGDRHAVNRVYANLGKAIAAYQRRLGFGPAPFDRYVERVLAGDLDSARRELSRDQEEGLRLFIGKGQCVDCHNGPLFSDFHFHNTGVPEAEGLPLDLGRAQAAASAREDEFNCLGPYSDARPGDCAELKYMVAEGEELVRAFRTPTLRGVAERAPYMHAGQLGTLAEVLAHYSRAPRAPHGRSELKRLRLSNEEQTRIAAFLASLSGPLAASPDLLRAPRPADPGGRPAGDAGARGPELIPAWAGPSAQQASPAPGIRSGPPR